VLPHLRVGATLPMKYLPVNPAEPEAVLATRIQQITPEDQGRFKGHIRVGLAVVNDGPMPPMSEEGGDHVCIHHR